MSNNRIIPLKKWFDNCGGWRPKHDMPILQLGIQEGLINEQDESGMTALCLAVSSNWLSGVEELLKAGAETERRYFRTGETALYLAMNSHQEKNEAIIAALIAANANPDAPNYWGITPRVWATRFGLTYFDSIPIRETEMPPPHIQNVEHLADHFHPRFKIPTREERESIIVGQAVDLYFFGPKSETKQDNIKVRVMGVSGIAQQLRYRGTIETPIERTHLTESTTELEFGPEHIASVYVTKPTKRTKKS